MDSSKKLELRKETVRVLSAEELGDVQGASLSGWISGIASAGGGKAVSGAVSQWVGGALSTFGSVTGAISSVVE
jgi:hypothetical protein